jgi:hypothetical protein
MLHTGLGRELLTRITQNLAELSTVEGNAIMEGRMLHLTVAPNRAGIERWQKENARQAEELEREGEREDVEVEDEEEDAEADADAATTER